MPVLPVLAGARVVRALEKAGFEVVRIRGSHHVLRHPDGRGTSVPVHGNQEVRGGTLRGILRDCGLTADEFLKLLDLRPDERGSCRNEGPRFRRRCHERLRGRGRGSPAGRTGLPAC